MQDGDSTGSLSRRWAAISGKVLLAFVPLIAGCRSDVAQQDAITLARSKGADVRISLKGDALRVDLRLLEFLSLNGLTLSDADMDSVARIRQLTSISVVDAKVSEDALRRFRDTNPQCAIAQ